MPVARLYSRMLRSSLSRAARSQAGCRQPHSQPLTKPDRKHSAIAGKSFVDAPCVYEQPGNVTSGPPVCQPAGHLCAYLTGRAPVLRLLLRRFHRNRQGLRADHLHDITFLQFLEVMLQVRVLHRDGPVPFVGCAKEMVFL